MNGIEDTPARRANLAVTVPVYEFREVLTVRAPRHPPVPGRSPSSMAGA